MNQLTVQNSNLISLQQRIAKPTASTNTPRNSFPQSNSDGILQKRMSVVNLEAAIGAQNSYQVDQVAKLGMAYRFNKACGIRVSPSLLQQSSFSLARHYMQ